MLTHGAVNMIYDGDGNRVSEAIGGTTTKYLVDSLNPTGLPQVIDETVSGAVTRTYAYGLQRISENQKISSTWTPSFYGYDGHGSVRFLTGSAGTTTDSYWYDAFGMPITTSGTTPNNYLYSGEQYDSALGMYYLRARYYSPPTGRFWVMDPYSGRIHRPVTLHKYTYTQNNPINATDPTGREILAQFVNDYIGHIYNTIYVVLPLGRCIGATFAAEAGVVQSATSGNGENIAPAGQLIAKNLGNLLVQVGQNYASWPLPLSMPTPGALFPQYQPPPGGWKVMGGSCQATAGLPSYPWLGDNGPGTGGFGGPPLGGGSGSGASGGSGTGGAGSSGEGGGGAGPFPGFGGGASGGGGSSGGGGAGGGWGG